LFPFRRLEEYAAWKSFLELIPATALRATRQYRERSWHVLSTLNRCGDAALDLAFDCPLLLFAVANNFVFGPRTSHVQRVARRLCSIKRRQAAAWLGFPETAATIRIFRKVPTASMTIAFCFYLRICLREGELVGKWLMHCPRINRGTIRLLADDVRAYVTPNLVFEVGLTEREDATPWSAYKIIDIIRIRNFLTPVHSKPERFKSIGAIDAEHEEAVDQLGRAGYTPRELQFLSLEFPRAPDLWCPLSEILSVYPIATVEGLIQLGRRQSHCAASWGHRVAQGEVYFYEVRHRQEMATLAVSRSDTGSSWKITQFLGPHNKEVSPEMSYLVRQWLAVAQDEESTMMPWDFYEDDIPF
jgi:hypothetical protein